jgi:triacylglycerol esterase/lipase EstA (alpha/beta hydrolase family)
MHAGCRRWSAATTAVAFALTGLTACSGDGDLQAPDDADPVIVVAGTFIGDRVGDVYFTPLVSRLEDDGFDVVVWAIPDHGLGDIADSAAVFAAFVAGVLDRTGADRVDIVAHSQGGLIGRYFIKNLGGADAVDSLVSLAAPHYGTLDANLATFLGLGSCAGIVACEQMSVDSSFLAQLNEGDDTIGDVSYTNIVTRFDEVVVPYTNGFLRDADNNTNVTLQSQCPFRFVGHVLLPLDPAAYTGIVDALLHRPIDFDCGRLT